MTRNEAIEQAAQAISDMDDAEFIVWNNGITGVRAIGELKKVLALPEDAEPVAYQYRAISKLKDSPKLCYGNWHDCDVLEAERYKNCNNKEVRELYTHPPKVVDAELVRRIERILRFEDVSHGSGFALLTDIRKHLMGEK
jgi:hypothetical protein